MLTRKQAQNEIREWAYQSVMCDEASTLFDFRMSNHFGPAAALMLAEKKKFIAQISSHVTKVTLSSAKQDWLTPPWFMDIVRRLGPIALDPCANPLSYTQAWTSFYGLNHIDGLAARWYTPENTVCFVNPPYGRTLKLWTSKMASEGSGIIRSAGAHLVALIPARTGTGYWEKYIWPFADAMCFWTGGTKHPARMCFYGLDGRPADTGATFDAAVVYFGADRAKFQRVFEGYGTVQLVN